MNWCKITSNSYGINYKGKVFKLTFENEKRAILEIKNDSSVEFEKLDYIEGDNKNEVLNNALNYLKILYPSITFDHSKDSFVEALGLSKGDSKEILKTIGVLLKKTNSVSETIEKLYEKYSNDMGKFIIAILCLGRIMEEYNARSLLEDLCNKYREDSLIAKIFELLSEDKEEDKKPWNDEMRYIQ